MTEAATSVLREATKPVVKAAGEAVGAATEAGEALSTDALRAAARNLVDVLAQGLTQAASRRITDLADRLTDYAEHGGPGLMAAVTGGKALAEGKSPIRAALAAGMTGLTQTAKGLVGRGGDGGAQGTAKTGLKVTNIVESADVGLPLRTTYDLWSQYTDFPSFMKKVEKVDRESDEKSTWQAQIFWSRRSWDATVVEQVPDSHIVWKSSGEKGHVDGAVTFTELGPNLTQVLLVLEYHPKGFFEQTANLWRAQGRRARLELKHFVRHATAHVLLAEDDVEGWRGEIRDGEVVVSHEDAVRAEQEDVSGEAEEEPEDAAEYDDELEDDSDEHNEDTDYDEDADYDEDEGDEPEPEPAGVTRGRGDADRGQRR